MLYGPSPKKSLVEVLREAEKLISEQDHRKIMEESSQGGQINLSEGVEAEKSALSESEQYRQILEEIESTGASEEKIIGPRMCPPKC